MGEGLGVVIAQIALLAAVATGMARTAKGRWLPILGLASAAAFSGWSLASGGSGETPAWLDVVIVGLYTTGTLAGVAIAGQQRISALPQFLIGAFAGWISCLVGGMLGMILWAVVASIL